MSFAGKHNTMLQSRMQLINMVASIIFLRILFIFIMGPMPQDAYYFFYSQHPALSYFEHPPMIAYLLKISSFIFGNNIIAIKIADSFLAFMTIILFYHLADCFLGERQLKKAMLLMISTLMMAIVSLVTTPDVPLLLFWTISLLFLYQAIFKNKPISWIKAGIAMGLAFDSKYTAIFLPAGLILFLLLSKPHRHYLLSKGFWQSVLSFLITILPVLIWNAENDFVSFKFQSAARLSPSTGLHFQIKYFLGLLGHQSLILTPVLFTALIYLVFILVKKYRLNFQRLAPEKLFLLCFFLPLVITFTLISFVCWVKLNWLMPAYLTAIIWASIYISRRWVAWQLLFSLIVHVLLAVEIIFYPVPIKSDDTWFGWNDLAKQVTLLKKTYPTAFVFSADGYKTAAELNLLVTGYTYSQNIIGESALEFDYVNANLATLKGKDALFIDSDPRFKDDDKEDKPNERLLLYFKSVEQLPPILIRQNGHTMRKFLVYHCSSYHMPGVDLRLQNDRK